MRLIHHQWARQNPGCERTHTHIQKTESNFQGHKTYSPGKCIASTCNYTPLNDSKHSKQFELEYSYMHKKEENTLNTHWIKKNTSTYPYMHKHIWKRGCVYTRIVYVHTDDDVHANAVRHIGFQYIYVYNCTACYYGVGFFAARALACFCCTYTSLVATARNLVDACTHRTHMGFQPHKIRWWTDNGYVWVTLMHTHIIIGVFVCLSWCSSSIIEHITLIKNGLLVHTFTLCVCV